MPSDSGRPAARRSVGGRLVRAFANTALPLAVVLAVLAVWEGFARAGLLPITVPAPTAILGTVGRAWEDLLYHMAPTAFSAVTGYLIALVLALTLGACATTWRRSEASIFRLGLVIDSIPLIALTPILMVWLGNGVEPRIVLAVIACLFPLLVGAIQGFKTLEGNAAELFHVLSASPWQRLRLLRLPSALPYLFAAAKVAAPLAVLGALIAEWIGAERGLGIMMIYALFSFDVALVWLTILAVSLMAMAAYAAIALAERLIVTWEGAPR